MLHVSISVHEYEIESLRGNATCMHGTAIPQERGGDIIKMHGLIGERRVIYQTPFLPRDNVIDKMTAGKGGSAMCMMHMNHL